MAAIDDLTAAVTKLNTDVDALIAAKATGVPAAQVEAQTQAIAAIDAKVVAATV